MDFSATAQNRNHDSPPARFYVLRLVSWEAAATLAEKLAHTKGGWYYRGHSDSTWQLSTTLERAGYTLRRENPAYDPAQGGNPLRGLSDVERRMLVSFRPQAHLHGVSIPYEASPFEWLAMIQHYGGPTRLLDFTKSFWVAVFHAIQPSHRRPTVDTYHCVWAVRSKPLWNQAIRALGLWEELAPNERRFMQERQRIAREQCVTHMRLTGDWRLQLPTQAPCLALPVEPEFLNARLRAQQGCFIFPLNDERPFQENLSATFQLDSPPADRTERQQWERGKTADLGGLIEYFTPGGITDEFREGEHKPVILKVILPSKGSNIREALEMLERMNITWASLFPDLTGIAQSGIASIWH